MLQESHSIPSEHTRLNCRIPARKGTSVPRSSTAILQAVCCADFRGFLHRSDFPDFCTDQISRIFAPIRFPRFLHRSDFPDFCTDQISRIFATIRFPGFLRFAPIRGIYLLKDVMTAYIFKKYLQSFLLLTFTVSYILSHFTLLFFRRSTFLSFF